MSTNMIWIIFKRLNKKMKNISRKKWKIIKNNIGILELKIIEIKIKNIVNLIGDFPVLSILLK